MASDDPNAEKKQQQPPAAESVEVVTEEKPVQVKEVVDEKTSTQTTKSNSLPDMKNLTVEELYDKEKYDMSTMEPGDVFTLLQ